MSWQSMDSAPKDGTPILVGRVGIKQMAVVEWLESRRHWSLGPGWTYFAGPTHWQPLPPAPSQEGASEGEGQT